VYRIRGEFGVCSRNLDLKEEGGTTFWQVARELDIEGKMNAVDKNWELAIQGELIGPGIQGNIYNLSKPQFLVFDVYDIRHGKYMDPDIRRVFIERMGLKHVPHLITSKVVSVEMLLNLAEGKSDLNPKQEREGIVFKEVNGGMTFKAISNKYLLGEK
jgi:RNA ligase (TIGR02306 family)